jgi:hypothetical protein
MTVNFVLDRNLGIPELPSVKATSEAEHEPETA